MIINQQNFHTGSFHQIMEMTLIESALYPHPSNEVNFENFLLLSGYYCVLRNESEQHAGRMRAALTNDLAVVF